MYSAWTRERERIGTVKVIMSMLSMKVWIPSPGHILGRSYPSSPWDRMIIIPDHLNPPPGQTGREGRGGMIILAYIDHGH